MLIKKFRIPYKYKFILFLIFIIVLTLSAFLWVSLNSFQNDKISYVYDYILNTNQAKIQNLDSIVKDMKSSVSLYLYNKDRSLTLSDKIKFVSSKEENRLIELYRTKDTKPLKLSDLKEYDSLLQKFKQNDSRIFTHKSYPELYFLTFLHPLERKVLILGFEKSILLNLFDLSDSQMSVLLTSKSDLQDYKLPTDFFDNFSNLKPGVITEKKLGNEAYLVVANKSETTNQSLVTALRRKDLFEFANSMRKQNTALALAIISIASILGILFSKRITNSIYEMIDAASEISKGNYQISFSKMEDGEIGDLQSTFLKMSSDIQASLVRERDIVRIENELKIASLVQQNFFSTDYLRTNNLEVSGYYEPASECGGDWWGFFEVEGFHYFFIGDATGHGASSALITAKAYSLVNTLKYQMQAKNLPLLEPASIMDNLNQVLVSSKQVLMMTFFVLRIDTRTQEIMYSNASHEFPLLIAVDDQTRQLFEKPQARLGHKKETAYKNYSSKLKSGDILFLYTDGLTECSNANEQLYGLKRTEKVIKMNKDLSTKEIVHSIVKELKVFNHENTFEDDVGLLLIKTFNT